MGGNKPMVVLVWRDLQRICISVPPFHLLNGLGSCTGFSGRIWPNVCDVTRCIRSDHNFETQHHDREVGKPLQFTRILSTCYAHRPVNRCSASSASSPLCVQLASNQPLSTSLPPPSGIPSDW